MRRLWAYATIAFTSLVVMGTSFSNIFLKSNSNLEYAQGREMVFFVSEKDEANPVHREGEESMALTIAKEMEKRLATYDLNSYEVSTMGDDAVKVTTYQDTDNRYSFLANYLSFNGSLALTTSKSKGTAVAWTNDGSEFISGKAYRTEIQEVNPAIVIPVNQEDVTFKEVLAEAQTAYEEAQANSTTDEDGNEKVEKVSLYFWHDYEAEDSYESLSTNQAILNNKLVMPLTYSPDAEDGTGSKDLYLNGDKNLMFAMLNQDINNDGEVTPEELKEAFWLCDYYIRLINAEELPYKVEYKYFNDAPAVVESLISIDTTDYLSNSATLVATLTAVAVISLLLVVFFRLGAVASIVSTVATAFSAVGFIVLFAAEFNTAGIMGILLATVASLVSGVIYLTKLKDEAYKGRSLKKANTEASKKSLLPIVDVNVVVIVIGAILFVLGGSIMRTFAVAAVLGGVVSLLLNTLFLKGMMWLATNTTKLTGKYNLFGIELDKVPDHTAEEKQKYFGPFADKDFTKKKLPIGICAAILFVASLAGTITFSALNNGDLFRINETAPSSEIVLQVKNDNENASDDVLGKLLSNVHTYTNGESTSEQRKSSSTTFLTYNDGVILGGQYSSPTESLVTYEKNKDLNYDEVTTYVYVITLDKLLSEETFAYIEDGEFTLGLTGDALTVNELFDEYLKSSKNKIVGESTLSLKTVNSVYSSLPTNGTYPKVDMILISTTIAIGVLTLYFMLRYRLSRGLATLIAPAAVSTITLGLLTLLRVAAASYIVVAIPFVAGFTLMIATIFMNKEREMVIDDRSHDNSVENRQNIMVKANSAAYTAILFSTILTVYLMINFFGFGPSVTAMIYLVAILGTLLADLFVTTLFGPISQLFYKWFKNMAKPSSKPRNPKKNKPVKKSAEPEEAVFIGIND